MTNGYNTPIGVPIGLPSILSLGLPPLVNPYPTLNLDFINNPQFDSRITFSRGSQATLFDSTGTLRYAKHNLLSYSEDFGDAAWSKLGTAAVTINQAIAPDGQLTADLLSGATDVVYNSNNLRASIGVRASNAYTFSVYVKSAGATTITLALRDGASGAQTTTVAALTSDWQRVTVSRTMGATTVATQPTIGGTDGDVYIWGAQLNQNPMEGGVTSSLTTYYPTTTAAYYAPRFDYNPSTLQPRGLLIEEQRTNSIRNNTMQGAVAGTPGTLPTNWVSLGAGLGTLTQQIVGIGTSAGITYIDIRISGTTSTASYGFGFDATTQIAALAGQSWTSAIYLALAGGATTNLTVSQRVVERNNVGTPITSTATNITSTLGTSLSRFLTTRTLTEATTAFVTTDVLVSFSAGVAIDITLRIGLPQLELGAFATSVIPTTTTALTRNADVASMTGTNFSSWYNNAAGTLFAEVVVNGSKGSAYAIRIQDAAATNIIQVRQNIGGTQILSQAVSAGGATPGLAQTTFTVGTVYKMAVAVAPSDAAASLNGSAVSTSTAMTTMPVVDRLTFENPYYIRRLVYYPTRLPNATLQALTA